MTTFRATLTCQHVVDVEADGVHTATSYIGAKHVCPKCPANASGDQPGRTIKLVRFEGDPVTEPKLTGKLPDELAADLAAEADNSVLQTRTSERHAARQAPAGSRMARYEAAKKAAANGGDVAAVLSEPVAETTDAPKRGRKAGRRTFLNLSPVRREALEAAGFPKARLEGKTVDLSQADVDSLLDGLGKVCGGDESTVQKAACRVAGWLEKYRSQV